MGHKVSVVHGVKSDDFFKPGNAINEIWLGRLEIISRLPFGDSDMGQAGWHSGGFPKIPWHNFIIPLKRRAEQKRVGEEGINEATMQLSFPVVILLCVVVVACALPVMVRRQTPSSWDRICKTDLSRRDNGLGGHGYAVRACIATISLAMGLVVLAPLVMDARGSGLGQASGSVMAFVSVVMELSLYWVSGQCSRFGWIGGGLVVKRMMTMVTMSRPQVRWWMRIFLWYSCLFCRDNVLLDAFF